MLLAYDRNRFNDPKLWIQQLQLGIVSENSRLWPFFSSVSFDFTFINQSLLESLRHLIVIDDTQNLRQFAFSYVYQHVSENKEGKKLEKGGFFPAMNIIIAWPSLKHIKVKQVVYFNLFRASLYIYIYICYRKFINIVNFEITRNPPSLLGSTLNPCHTGTFSIRSNYSDNFSIMPLPTWNATLIRNRFSCLI